MKLLSVISIKDVYFFFLTVSFYSWFQTFDVFWMLYAFFWLFPWHLNFTCQHFGTLCLFHLRTHLWRWNRQSVPKCWHIKFRRRGINQKKAYDSIFLHCFLSFEQQQKLKDTAFGCICTVMQLFTGHTNYVSFFSLIILHMFQEELHILSLMVAWCEHSNKSFQIYKRSDQVSLGGSAFYLYLGDAWFEYWLENQQTWLELMWFSWDRICN